MYKHSDDYSMFTSSSPVNPGGKWLALNQAAANRATKTATIIVGYQKGSFLDFALLSMIAQS